MKEKYLLVSNNIEDEKYMYVGLKLMQIKDFSKIDFYTVTISIFGIATLSLIVVYFILNNSLNKLIEKEEREMENY